MMICQSGNFYTEQTQSFHSFPFFFSKVSTTVFAVFPAELAVAARDAMMEMMVEIVTGSIMSECRLRLIEGEEGRR
nr:hypothetical protein Iba_chr07cCG13220 [Ipomoea batatas]